MAPTSTPIPTPTPATSPAISEATAEDSLKANDRRVRTDPEPSEARTIPRTTRPPSNGLFSTTKQCLKYAKRRSDGLNDSSMK